MGWSREPRSHPYPRTASLAECSSFSPPTTVILLILLCFEALLFLIFTSVMFGTQVHSICTDETVSRGLWGPGQVPGLRAQGAGSHGTGPVCSPSQKVAFFTTYCAPLGILPGSALPSRALGISF